MSFVFCLFIRLIHNVFCILYFVFSLSENNMSPCLSRLAEDSTRLPVCHQIHLPNLGWIIISSYIVVVTELIFVTNITNYIRGEKNCDVEKFQLSIQNVNNFWSFIEVYAVFVPNLCGDKSVRRKSVWSKNEKYEVWPFRLLWLLKHQPC